MFRVSSASVFSVFMLADKVRVTSRRFDAGPNDTITLEFENGLRQRPILYHAQHQQRLSSAGTKIEIDLDSKVFEKLTSPDDEDKKPVLDRLRYIFPCSDVALDVSFLDVSLLLRVKTGVPNPRMTF